jgi:CRISPR-associated protein Csb2
VTHLLLSVRFLDDRYHGLLDRGGPVEWPPSPFRLFQAMVAGVARRGELVVGVDEPSNANFAPIGIALGWLQTHSRVHPPIIIAPKHKVGQAITRFVPNNDGDKKFDRQGRLTAKPTIPTLFLLEPGQKPEVHYVWDISDAPDAPVDRIRDAARSLTTLGWGIDMAFADADRADEAKLQTLKGIRWYPKKDIWRNDGMLRTPTYDDDTKECTLCDLRHCHATAINRIEHGKPLKTVDKPKIFDRILYTSTERPIGHPYRVFRLVDENGGSYRYPNAKLIHIAGMVRHAAIEAMKEDPPPGRQNDQTWLETFVCGHRSNGELRHEQLSYVPLPSIGNEHADAMI